MSFLITKMQYDVIIAGAQSIKRSYDAYTAISKGIDPKLDDQDIVSMLWAEPKGINNSIEFWGYIQHNVMDNAYNVHITGTKSLDDWINNAELVYGWEAIYKQIARNNIALLRDVASYTTINIFGHSAGAAMGRRFSRDLGCNHNLYNFEPPKDNISIDTGINFINTWDIVPKVPELFGYHHPGVTQYYSDNRDNIIDNHSIDTVIANLIKLKEIALN